MWLAVDRYADTSKSYVAAVAKAQHAMAAAKYLKAPQQSQRQAVRRSAALRLEARVLHSLQTPEKLGSSKSLQQAPPEKRGCHKLFLKPRRRLRQR
jgi:hypothetical protein